MKTKFFKKLSFVLVVAMVLSVFAPAAGVFAAKAPKLNSTKKYLHLDVDKLNEFNFNISNKGKGWKYYWETADEEVAVVNEKNGVVTATGVGTTKVTCYITDKDGEEITDLTATVVVRDNIKTVKITNVPEDNKLAVDEANDFNRSFETVSGSKKKTSAITRWTVEPAEGATIDEKGVFVATEAGKYTVTALSFQSKARYEAWLDDAETYKDYVLATDSVEITVEASIVDVKQVNKNSFTVEFDSDMKDADLTASTALVYQVINGKLYNTGTEKIKSVTLDETGKFATVETYGNFISKATYQFTFGDMKALFTAANTDMSEIAGIVFDDFQVKTDGSAVNMLEKVNAVNSDGVVILTGAEIAAYLTFEYAGDYAYGWINGTDAFINKDGYAGKVKVTYNNFVYDEATKTYKTVKFEDEAMAIGVNVVLSNTTMQYAVAKSEPASWESKWATNGFTVPAGDGAYFIYTRYKRNTDPATADYIVDNSASTFRYVTTNSDKLVINGNSIYPVSQGVVTVLVQDPSNNNVVVGTFDVTIVGSRAYASAEVDTPALSLGNHDFVNDAHEESKRFTIMNKDSMGDALLVSAGTPEAVNPPATAVLPTVVPVVESDPTSDDFGKVFLNVNAAGATKGAYQFKVTLSALNSSKTVNVFVNVLEGYAEKNTLADVVRWTVELSESNVDLKKQEGPKNLGVNVYGYNVNNARIYALDAAEYSLTVKKGNTTTDIKTLATPFTSTNIPVADYTSGSALGFVDLASYVVTAKAVGASNPTGRADGVYIGAATFTVADTTELAFVRDNASVSATSYGTVADAIKKAFTFKINGTTVDEDTAVLSYKVTKGGNLTTDNGSSAVYNGDNLYVHEVYYTTTWDGGTSYITYTFKIGQSITITK